MTDKQKRFINEYMVDLNATAAAKRAGYSEKTAYSIGQRLLKNVEIQVAIQQIQNKMQNKLEITQERVMQELAAVAFAEGTDFIYVDEIGNACPVPTYRLSEQQKKAISVIRQGQNGRAEIKLYDKIRALELIGKHLGMFESGHQKEEAKGNNLFEMIERSTREEIDTDAIPEIEPETIPGDDMVE